MTILRRDQVLTVMNSTGNLPPDEQFPFDGQLIAIYTTDCYLHFHLYSNLFTISIFY